LTPFTKALIDIPGYEAMFPELDRVFLCDVDGDGNCNFGDLTPFVELLSAGRANSTAVPEPSACLLAAATLLSGMMLNSRRCKEHDNARENYRAYVRI
jgi:hypothetical protein